MEKENLGVILDCIYSYAFHSQGKHQFMYCNQWFGWMLRTWEVCGWKFDEKDIWESDELIDIFKW